MKEITKEQYERWLRKQAKIVPRETTEPADASGYSDVDLVDYED